MKLSLSFTEKDFSSLSSFEKSVKSQLGQNVYVGTDSLCLYFNYPKKLAAMLRPFPEQKEFQFELDSN